MTDKSIALPPRIPVPPSLGRDIGGELGKRLRALYDDVVSQPLDARFVALLDRLAKLDRKGKAPATGADRPELDPSVRKAILAAVPNLRAFAISLSGNVDRADDLVQETLLRALANIHSFEPGTNMPAWLFTILRNLFRSEYRKRRREVEDADGSYAETLKSQPEQEAWVEFQGFRTAMAKLPPDQREALILAGASGFSYEEAAAICGCAVGTIKSRVNRARIRLAELMSIESVDDFGPDRATRAVLAG
jgi:RNA polymerase sigma-70 factor (ECF subfamily)